MLKFGKIDEVQPETGRARVVFEGDGLKSDWIPLIVRKSKSDKDFFMFDVGDHVSCMMDEHCENGVILGAIYDDGNKPEGRTADMVGVTFSDGSSVLFDRSNGTYTIDMKGEVSIKGAPKVTVDCDLTVNGKITANGVEASGTIKADGNIESNNGNVIALAGLAASRVTLIGHMHPTAAPGPPSVPTPGL